MNKAEQIVIALLVLAPILLPEYRDPKASRLDIVSAAFSLIAVLSAIYGIKRLAEYGLGWTAAVAIVFGLAVATNFALRQLKLKDTLIEFQAPIGDIAR